MTFRPASGNYEYNLLSSLPALTWAEKQVRVHTPPLVFSLPPWNGNSERSPFLLLARRRSQSARGKPRSPRTLPPSQRCSNGEERSRR
jgi:hypothetical protein